MDACGKKDSPNVRKQVNFLYVHPVDKGVWTVKEKECLEYGHNKLNRNNKKTRKIFCLILLNIAWSVSFEVVLININFEEKKAGGSCFGSKFRQTFDPAIARITQIGHYTRLSHSMATAYLNKSEDFVTNTTAASKPRSPRISINWNFPFHNFFMK